MKRVRVNSIGFEETYDSPQAALNRVRHAKGQDEASWATQRINSSALEGATWSDTEAVLEFSNGSELRVFLDGRQVSWELVKRGASTPLSHSIGAEPFKLLWGPSDEYEERYDPSALIAKRIDQPVARLFVCEGLMLYCQSLPILWFRPMEHADTQSLMLYMSETD